MSEDRPASLKLAHGGVLVVSALAAAQGDLLPDEERLLNAAQPMRRRELIAGRRMAHRAMSELDIAPTPKMMEDKRRALA